MIDGFHTHIGNRTMKLLAIALSGARSLLGEGGLVGAI
jgi:hypothetical protein